MLTPLYRVTSELPVICKWTYRSQRMTQAVGHRGPQPPNYVSSFARPKAGSKKAAQQPKAPANGVKFGGAGQALLNGSVGTFQNITEVFLWGFLAQDMIAMWLPRVWTSLQEGRKPYEPAKDPAMKDKPFGEQLRAWLTGNAQGLNWVNFYEGTKREIATGPGLLAVPAAAFMINRAMMNPGIELSYGALKGMGEGLKKHIGNQSFEDKAKFTKSVKDYLKQAFADSELKGHSVKVTDANGKEQTKLLSDLISDWVDAEVDASVEHAGKNPGIRVVSNFKRTFGIEKETKDFKNTRSNLENAIWEFNRNHRINEYGKGTLIHDEVPLNNTGKTWHSYAGNPSQKTFNEIRNDVTRMGGFINKMWDNHTKDASKGMGEVVEHTMKQMVGNKWLFGMGITTLTAAYLVKLAFWAQNSHTYQATRLLNADAAKSKGNTPQGNAAECSRNGHSHPVQTQSQAGLPFGSQPAFSHLQTAFPVRPQVSLSRNGFIHSPVNQANNAFFRGQQVEGGQA